MGPSPSPLGPAFLPGLLLVLLLGGCVSSGPAPVTERGLSDLPASGVYRVHDGDTLYSIAWRYGLDWQQLARRNHIRPPYLIQPGQRIDLRVGPEAPVGVAARAPASPSQSAPVVRPRPTAAPPKAAGASVAKAAPTGPVHWQWPLKGTVVAGFAPSGSALNKGIDIRGAEGGEVRVAAAGEVVYAGTGLRGHSALVIVKHDDTWLSAYAHDSRILVREGQRLAAGATLARLGSDARTQVLHFEIRRDGKPVDPASLLP